MRTFIRNLRHEDHKKALVATLVFIFLMILFFLLVSLEYPDPPPKEKVVEVEIEFGSDYEGGGQISETPEIPTPQPESATEKATQEESPVVVKSSKGTSKTSKNTTTSNQTTPNQKDPKPNVDDAFDFTKIGSGGSGGGGDKGIGQGSGVGGGGKGSEPGAGTTNTSRKLKSKGSIPGNSQKEGKIALDLHVNEFGKVVRTKFNESKSTSRDAYLIELAKKNAMTYVYESIPGAPTQYVGTVVFNFRKQ